MIPFSSTIASRLSRETRQWLVLSALAAAGVTIVDSLLLGRQRGLFRGGFLAYEYLASTGERAGFLLVSFLVDFALAAPLIGLTLAGARRLGLRPAAAGFLALVVALTPAATDDFFSYQLGGFLGQTFDLSLMLDLVGGDVREFIAVAGGHIAAPLWFAVFAGGAVAAVTATLHRFAPGQAVEAVTPPGRRGWLRWAAVWPLGLVIMTAARLHSVPIDNGMRLKPSGKMLGFLVTKLTDFDRDGYGLLEQPADPAPFDARIHPYAIDVPGNGIDEDGLVGDLPLADANYTERPPPPLPWKQRPDVVLVFLESVRADVVGSTFEGKPVTPTLDGLAAEGASSQLAYSQNGFTTQSRYHMLSGSMGGLRGDSTLIDDFKRNGYQTVYISGQDDSFGGPTYSIGFDRADFFYDARREPERRYTAYATPGSLAVPFSVVEEHVDTYLAGADQRPLFLYVNFGDTHFPYHHNLMRPLVSDVTLVHEERTTKTSGSAITPDRRNELWAMYVNGVANVDHAIGDVLASVARWRGRAPAVVVLSDHGESLFEEGFIGHGYALSEAQTRIPFVTARLPMKITEPFGETDVRDLISDALSTDDGSTRPSLVPSPDARVFQYIGTVDHPREVGFRTLAGRVSYDFRTGAIQRSSVSGTGHGTLADDDVTRLLRFWEAIRVAQDATSR